MSNILATRSANLSTFSAIAMNYSTLNTASNTVYIGQSTNKTTTLAQGNYSIVTNWISTNNTISTGKVVAMSANAQTQLVVTQLSTVSSLYYTSTLGQSWSTLSGASGLPIATQTIYNTGAVSGDGRVVAVAASGGYIYTSNNGASFTNTNPNAPAIYLPFETVPVNGTIGGTTLTVTGSPTLVTGIVGSNALNLANNVGGIATNYIRGTWSGAVDFTINFWFNLQSVGNHTLFINSPNNFVIQVNTSFLQYYSGNGIDIRTSFPIVVNTWYNLTAIYKAFGVCSLYINNVLIGQGTSSGGHTNSVAFNLGCYDNSNGALNGYIDDFKLYNSAIIYPVNYNNIALSNTGQYMLASVTGGSLYVSANYGSTWTQITSVSTASTWLSMAVSATGQYMVAVSQTGNNAPVYSTNYGITWNQTTFIGITGTIVALSGSGQYCLGIGGTTAYLIPNYLVGFTTTVYSQPTLAGINANISGAAISSTGQYMVIVTSGTTNNVYYSNNYGSTFIGITVGSLAMTGCAISADGFNITVTNGTTIYQLNNNSSGFSVAIGNNTGVQNQGLNAIAIGNQAGTSNQSKNSIILNASGSTLNSYSQGLYAAPIATAASTALYNVLGYGTDNQIVQTGLTMGSAVSSQTIYGEWIQLQLTTAVYITSYQLAGRVGYPTARYPFAWTLVGSVDGVNWTILDSQDGQTGFGSYTLKVASAIYSYFRIIITSAGSLTDIGGFILFTNGTSVFGANANYTIAAGSLSYYNILQLSGVTVCTTTFSWNNTGSANALGITGDGQAGLPSASFWSCALLPTTDGYSKTGAGNPYYAGLQIVSFGSAFEYSSSNVATQGTATVISTTNVYVPTGYVGIGTAPQYTLDVAGTVRTSGNIVLGAVSYQSTLLKSIPGLTQWFDAADPLNNGGSSLPSNGTSVNTWFDKSGNGNNASALYATPTFSTNMINGLPSMNFTNSSGYKSNSFQNSFNVTFFLVGIVQSTSSTYGTFWGQYPAGNWNNYVQLRRANNTGFQYVQWETNNNNNPNTTVVYGAPVIYMCTMSGGTVMTMTQITTNGTTTATNTVTQSITSISCPTWIGAGDGNYYTQSYISEIIMYQSVLTTAQQQLIQGYLAWKWGLNTQMVTSQPYYSINPILPALPTNSWAIDTRTYVNSCSIIYNSSAGTPYYAFNVLPNGNVGIGTANPNARLSIVGSGLPTPTTPGFIINTSAYDCYNGNGSINVYSNDINLRSGDLIWENGAVRVYGAQIYVQGGYSLVGGSQNQGVITMSTGNAARMTIAGNGNVGIGATNPETLFFVKSGSSANSTGQPSGTFAATIYNANNVSGGNGLLVKNNWNADSSIVFEAGQDYVGSTYLSFLRVYGSGVTYMRGNVGIGITNPSSLLHLYSTSTTAIPFVMSGIGETYALSSSAKNTFFIAGTLASWYNTYTGTTTATLIDIGATPASNGSSNVYFGAVAGPTGNGPAHFVIGRRSGVFSWTESVRVDTSGNVGIGGSPTATFHVHGDVTSYIRQQLNEIKINGNGYSHWSLFGGRAGRNYFSIANTSTSETIGTPGTDVFCITSGNNVGIGITNPGYTLHVIGSIYASGDITALSDKRYKQDIVPLLDSLNRITQLTGYSYTRTDTDNKHIGLIAQEVNEVFPEAVSYKNDSYSLNYGCLIAPVIQAMKELKERVDKQDELIQQLLHRLRPE